MKNVNAIRTLSIDMIEKSNSGHPGICMGAAPMMESLFAHKLNISSNNSKWFNRDRFVLAAGHGSAMLYSTLHLSGYDISIEDLKNFRQLGSKTPGHPEVTHTDGVDATSGPLGQGISQAVGMAMAEAHLASKYNREDFKVVDHYTYALCGDGDLQEGVASEASSLAGHLGLNKLIVLWDSNDIQLDDATDVATTENIRARYEAYGWNTILVKDGNTTGDIKNAIEVAKVSDKPTLIEVKTTIGFGAPTKAGSSASHGAPLGAEEATKTKEAYGWDLEPFTVTEDIYENFRSNTVTRGDELVSTWNQLVADYTAKYPELGAEFAAIIEGKKVEVTNLDFELGHSEASRVSSGKAINNINGQIPNLIGGSADLSKSNNTTIADSGIFGVEGFHNQNISFGVREFAMASAVNGMLLHGGVIAYSATFFVFSDYLKPALRMSAIQKLPAIYVLTHDSVAVGEDGPTHEPIEQLSGLRAIPNVNVIRPADANETQAAWNIAINSTETPTVLVLSRQNLEVITNSSEVQANVNRGGYVLVENAEAETTLIATGSEVKLAKDVAEKLTAEGTPTRVVSMPSINTFRKQDAEYKKSVLGDGCKCNRYFIEMASAVEGYEFAGNLINIETFGESGEGSAVINHFGFNVESVYNKIK
ncbi:transketolase [Mollicutes bacterium LVI A0078]|nr:transketolase [Mollicutes bacterium LVI A0075]WOO91592.1 transketolase [Mollicutes bacterium LVI A0078]